MDSFSNLCHSLMGLKGRHKHIYTATETDRAPRSSTVPWERVASRPPCKKRRRPTFRQISPSQQQSSAASFVFNYQLSIMH